jgi:predicted Fe-Mo cluster-binding NifX family protein
MKLKGVEAIRTAETSPEEAVKKFIAGELAILEPIVH